MPPQLRHHQSSNMSLFGLFSKSKVEKLRGYAEPGLDAPFHPPRASSNSETCDSKQDIITRLQTTEAEQGQVRPTTSRSYTSRAARLISKEPSLPQLSGEQRLRAFDPPPLFQVWPQSTNYGTLQTTTPAPEVRSTSPKSRLSSKIFLPGSDNSALQIPGNRASIDSRATIKTQLRPLPSGSSSQPILSRKLIVLVTSGYLLQYAETGPNDRLPEKILELGKDSAAYASDLIPGKYHVLQISQAVDQRGVAVAASHSLFSKIGLRKNATRRTASDFLLVMSDADEMAEWMTAIRKEIESQGGKRARCDSSTSRPRGSHPPKIDLEKTPSQSHRYNVRRNPNGPSTVSTPTLERFPSTLTLQLRTEQDSKPSIEAHTEETVALDSKQEQQGVEGDIAATRPRAGSDVPSFSSSADVAVEQQQLEKLRNSTRISHTSTAATSVTAASRTNSMTSSPSEYSKDSCEGARDGSFGKPPFRNLSSYSLLKRRSAAPLTFKDCPVPEISAPPHPHPNFASNEGSLDSPVIGYGSSYPEPTASPKNNRLSSSQSLPNFTSTMGAKRDSKMAMATATPPEERPQSFIADLPSQCNWTSRPLPNQRASAMPFAPLPETSPTGEGKQLTTVAKPRTSPTSRPSPNSRPLWSGSQSFSLPLRVNSTDSQALRSPKRTPPAEQEERVISPIPAVTCLTAKVDFGPRTTINASHMPQRRSSSANSPHREGSGKQRPLKLSLFPSAQMQPPPPIMARIGVLSPSASSTVRAALTQSRTAGQTGGGKLSRPASLQVRATHAPFLSSVRSSAMSNSNVCSTTTAPIRGLRPSRSVATMQTTQISAPSTGFDFGTSDRLAEEATDEAKPLPERCISPAIVGNAVPRPSSRNNRTSLLNRDYGLPLSAFGPPAPPPSAPLPEIPGGQNRLSMVRSGTPIGLAIGDALDEHSPQKENHLHRMGLGIKVGADGGP
ncbi:Hypothetical predicted protein [Lecanosticta acicola]|uniref:PH domain-containing protein n=1 Tax=Lecanosticta acicola TaxID=111012 RepID=A0AAI8Z689_9PEZI|nr:Hypothetical predicted protein [Lecanosticta acicola]